MQRSKTDFDVYEFISWCQRNDKLAWFGNTKHVLKINAKTLRKSLDRLTAKNEIKEYALVSNKKDMLGRNHSIFYKGYKITK